MAADVLDEDIVMKDDEEKKEEAPASEKEVLVCEAPVIASKEEEKQAPLPRFVMFGEKTPEKKDKLDESSRETSTFVKPADAKYADFDMAKEDEEEEEEVEEIA